MVVSLTQASATLVERWHCCGVQGFDARSYGRGMADVYDRWYGDVSDVEATVEHLVALAGPGGGPVLELGVGTGRLAIPLAARGVEVHGVDTSPDMLALLTAKPGGNRVHAIEGDMAGDRPRGPFAVVFVAYNTLFSLTSAEAQQDCFASVARRLMPGGRFVVEAFVPDTQGTAGGIVEVREVEADRVVLSVSRTEPNSQTAAGQFVELSEASGVRLRPWWIRWSTPEQLDVMASAAGLTLERRSAGWRGETFDTDSSHHVSTWRNRQR